MNGILELDREEGDFWFEDCFDHVLHVDIEYFAGRNERDGGLAVVD